MIKKNYFTRHVVVHSVIISLTMVGVFALDFLDKKSSKFDQAKTLYAEAIASTSLALQEGLSRIVANPALEKNVALNLEHSVTQALLAEGKGDLFAQLEIYSADCEHRFAAIASPGKSTFCGKYNKAGYTWVSTQGVPALILTKALSWSGQNFFLTGKTVLDTSWLNRFQTLQALFQELKLSIQSVADQSKKNVLLLEGLNAEGTYDASLTTESFVGKTFYSILHTKPLSIKWLLLFSLTLLLLYNLRLLFLSAKRMKDDEAFILQFKKWTESIVQNPHVSWNPKKDTSHPYSEPFEFITSQIKKLLQEQVSVKEGLKSKQDELQKAAQDLVMKLKGAEQKVRDLSKNSSLAIQIKESAPDLILTLHQHEECLSDFQAILQQEMQKHSKELSSFIQEWRSQIDEKGTRKFIRSLYETPSTHHASLLEEELAKIFAMSEKLFDQCVDLSLFSERLVADKARVKNIFAHWYSLTLQKQTRIEASSDLKVSSVLQKAEAILKENPRFSHIRLINHVPEELTLPLRIQEEIWVSSFFHVLRGAAAFCSKETNQALLINARIHLDKQFIVISAVDHLQLEAENYDLEVAPHIRTAENLVSGFGVSCRSVNTIAGISSFALIWEELSLSEDQSLFSAGKSVPARKRAENCATDFSQA